MDLFGNLPASTSSSDNQSFNTRDNDNFRTIGHSSNIGTLKSSTTSVPKNLSHYFIDIGIKGRNPKPEVAFNSAIKSDRLKKFLIDANNSGETLDLETDVDESSCLEAVEELLIPAAEGSLWTRADAENYAKILHDFIKIKDDRPTLKASDVSGDLRRAYGSVYQIDESDGEEHFLKVPGAEYESWDNFSVSELYSAEEYPVLYEEYTITPESVQNSSLVKSAEFIIFTNRKVTEGAKVEKLADGIVCWLEELMGRSACFISTEKTNLKVNLSPNSTGMFKGFENLKVIDLDYVSTSTVFNVSDFFRGCNNLSFILDTSKDGNKDCQIYDMSRAFAGCGKLIYVSDFFTNENGPDVSGIFKGCKLLGRIGETIATYFSGETERVPNETFLGCDCLKMQAEYCSTSSEFWDYHSENGASGIKELLGLCKPYRIPIPTER